jgi:regulation of enolase protein 1 (concanavalin A-like superfamily)
MNSSLTPSRWLNKPKVFEVNEQSIIFTVLPKTDFWQITHYGFSRVDGNCLAEEIKGDVSFKVKVTMDYSSEFDQAGVMIYYDDDNWAKMSIENQLHSRNKLGSVVTKNKRSDWASQEVDNLKEIWYKISKRGHNYLFEYSYDDVKYSQIRLFDFQVGDDVKHTLIGVYGGSPLGEGFEAKFEHFAFSENEWFLNANDIPSEFK